MVDSPKSQMSKLLVGIHAKTLAKELQWQPVSGSVNKAITAAVGENSVKLTYYPYKNGNISMLDLKFSVYNSSGIETDSIRDTELKGVSPPVGYPGWYSFMQEIHDLASRQLLGSDQTLDEVLKDLGL